MLNIVVVSRRQNDLRSFLEALQADEDVVLEKMEMAADVLEEVQKRPPNLVIIDYHLGDMAPLDLAKDLLKINALVNIAVVSTMNEEDFHEATEGLGLLPRLPSPPLATDGPILLKRLREVSGLS